MRVKCSENIAAVRRRGAEFSGFGGRREKSNGARPGFQVPGTAVGSTLTLTERN